ncbi:MAG: LytTR family DNA-binding domain-containing protein, partial [Bryobacteraceae bacterium]|nr:LytTR family DNA-binding domain-containing protein [Bryobacteraceae bacterium]
VEALAAIHDREPDVVFLDLQMPDLDGFGVAKALRRDRLPLVVFVTAYDKHALEAFETGAVDYLLKPIRQERLAAALERVKAQLSGVKAAARETAPAGAPRKIVGRLGSDQYLLDPSEVIAFVADGELVYIVTAQQRYLANQPLRAIEERLTSNTFRRIHRRTIINTDHIRRISPLSSKRWQLKMSNGIEVVVSKRMAGVIRQEMRW